MEFLLANSFDATTAFGLIILYVMAGIVGLAVLVSSIWLLVARIRVWAIYGKFNKIANSENLTAREATEKFKELCGLDDVQIKQCGFFKSIVSAGSAVGFGNEYDAKKKTIFLRKNIMDKNSITAVGVSTQKVGAAVLDKNGDKDYKLVSKLKPVIFWIPILFIPLVIVGVLLDYFLMGMSGIISIVFALVSIGFMIFAVVVMKKAIKNEKNANNVAMQMMNETNFLTEEERGYIQKIYNAYMTSYVAEYVQLIIQIIYEIIRLLISLLKIFSKKN